MYAVTHQILNLNCVLSQMAINGTCEAIPTRPQNSYPISARGLEGFNTFHVGDAFHHGLVDSHESVCICFKCVDAVLVTSRAFAELSIANALIRSVLKMKPEDGFASIAGLSIDNISRGPGLVLVVEKPSIVGPARQCETWIIPVFRFADGFFGPHVPTGEIYEFVYWWHNSGLHSVCGTLGWALQATWHRETVHFIMARVKQALCTPAESLADTFRFAQFAYSMNHLHGSQPAEHHGTANIKVKAFGIVIFEGRVDASARLLQVQHLWSEACRIVDIPAGALRFVHAGKQMNPEFRWCDFQQNETGPLVVHLQSPLEGGGKNFDKDGQTSMKAKNALDPCFLPVGRRLKMQRSLQKLR